MESATTRLTLFLVFGIASAEPRSLLSALDTLPSMAPTLTLYHVAVVGSVLVVGLISLIAIVAHRVAHGRPIINFSRSHTISVAEEEEGPYPML